MKGGAHKLWSDFCQRHEGSKGNLFRSLLILKAQVIPEQVGPDLDDEVLESRLRAAIAKIEEDEGAR